jgi:MOSC domain-containing protein YiiM
MNSVVDQPETSGGLGETMASRPGLSLRTVEKIFLCPEHIYTGRFNQTPGRTPMTEVPKAQVIAGRGFVGDRYFARPAGHKGQVTFFAEETWRRLGAELKRTDLGLDVFRRNVILRGVDLLALIGVEFEVQGVRFRGVEHCKPCSWMDAAFVTGTWSRLSGWQAGGLRAAVLSDGWLKVGQS